MWEGSLARATDIEWEGSSEKNGWYVKVHSKDISKIVKKS